MPAMIETVSLTRYYGALCAVDHLDLNVGQEIFGLLGPNGSGKTTTVLILTTLLHPTEGRASVCGHDVVREATDVRSRISYVPQDMAVDIKLTGRENVGLFARLYGVSRPKDRVDEVLGIMELSDRADDLVKTYSGGMRRRLELAQALVHEPSVLFLDEPTIGLDVAARKRIWDHIISLKKKGMAIFITTHYMDEADHACDRIGIISKGRLIGVGSPGDLKAGLRQSVLTVTVADLGPATVPIPDGMALLRTGEAELVYTADHGASAVPVLHEALTAAGFTVTALSLHEPTLDDVFLGMVGSFDDPEGFDDRKFRLMLRRRR